MSIEQDTLRYIPRSMHEEYLNNDGSFECPVCEERTIDYDIVKHRKVCINCACEYADLEIRRRKEEVS